jgi:peptidoglycan/xylan/chitin deacetylase (PgdA/CDA1 family)
VSPLSSIKRLAKRALAAADIIVESLPDEPHAVLLTFDDGPDPERTPRILDILDAYGARACFFVVGKLADAAPDLVREIVARDHAIGNHSYGHPKARLGPRAYATDVARCQETLARITGEAPALFRPIRGEITVGSTWAARHVGSPQVLWSREGGEWGKRKRDSAESIADRLCRDVADGDIVLLHDDNDKVPVILERLLPVLVERDLDLTTGVQRLLQ